MKKLIDIIDKVPVKKILGNIDINIDSIQIDSRKIKNNDLFVALIGTNSDGHIFIKGAIENGAKAIVCEKIPSEIDNTVTFLVVDDSAFVLGLLCANYFENPQKKLKIVGVTGTNGKTTIATTLYRLALKLGYKAGLISTVIYCVNEKEYESTHTTPDPLRIYSLLSEMVKNGCSYCFMEVSSHSLVQKRIAGLDFTGAIFTNITHDHLDYHKTFDEYIKAKKLLFDNLSSKAFSIINKDDKNGKIMIQNTKSLVYWYSVTSVADFKGKIIEEHIDGMLIEINKTQLWTKFIGKFNIYNLLAIYAAAIKLGFDEDKVIQQLSILNPVRGRFEYVKSKNNILAIIDYAHTPDALVNVLETIRELIKSKEQIITVVGAGGNRDKLKRPKMARVSVDLSDKVVLTSDNPRFEDPADILNDMIAGLNDNDKGKYLIIPDRREAIKTAAMLAKPGDIILLAGKGHETYQEIKGVKHHFDDKEVISEIFNNM